MPLTINLVDVPAEGLPVECEVQPSEVALPPDDGKIIGLLSCVGQIFSPDERMAHFQGTLTGEVARECVRCLTTFEEVLSLSFDADFCQLTQSVPLADSSRKKKKATRGPDPVDEEYEKEADMYPITDGRIDLLPALRENIILATPLHPLCQQDCAGLCQVCGANLNEGICGCYSPVTASSSLIEDTASVFSKNAPKPSPRLA
jgi:uncharacterized protein